MLTAVLAEQIRGGILLFISILIAVFFFFDASVNIFKDRGGKDRVPKNHDRILIRVDYNGSMGERLATLKPRQRILVGFGPECDLNLSEFDSASEKTRRTWFSIVKDATGVLMIVKDDSMNNRSLEVCNPEDGNYRFLTDNYVLDKELWVKKDPFLIKLVKQD